MTIYSVIFGKGDYSYSIKYHNDNNDLTLDTNEAPLDSFKLSVGTMSQAIREYLEISDGWEVAIKAIKFLEKDVAISVVITKNNDEYPKPEYSAGTKIAKNYKEENYPNMARIKVLENAVILYDELEKYLRGEKLQKELPLNESEEETEQVIEGDFLEFN